MQFDKDLNSKNAELFLQIRDFLMESIGKDRFEKQSENITSYFCKEGGICYIRTKDNYLHIGWFRGIHIEDKYNLLFGNGKTIRGHTIREFDELQKEAVKYYIDETITFLIEHNELAKLRKKGIK